MYAETSPGFDNEEVRLIHHLYGGFDDLVNHSCFSNSIISNYFTSALINDCGKKLSQVHASRPGGLSMKKPHGKQQLFKSM
jgi:hypothetical protein